MFQYVYIPLRAQFRFDVWHINYNHGCRHKRSQAHSNTWEMVLYGMCAPQGRNKLNQYKTISPWRRIWCNQNISRGGFFLGVVNISSCGIMCYLSYYSWRELWDIYEASWEFNSIIYTPTVVQVIHQYIFIHTVCLLLFFFSVFFSFFFFFSVSNLWKWVWLMINLTTSVNHRDWKSINFGW